MRKRTLKVALLAALATILVLSFSSVALADQTWSDLPDTVTAKYGITDNQVASISDGFPDGTWKPYQAVTRAQFTKMAVMAFGIPLANPATPSFTDVPKTHIHYQYIEGAKAAGVVNGTTATTFGPSEMITRAQAAAIVSRYVAQANGYNLATMYTTAQIDACWPTSAMRPPSAPLFGRKWPSPMTWASPWATPTAISIRRPT